MTVVLGLFLTSCLCIYVYIDTALQMAEQGLFPFEQVNKKSQQGVKAVELCGRQEVDANCSLCIDLGPSLKLGAVSPRVNLGSS